MNINSISTLWNSIETTAAVSKTSSATETTKPESTSGTGGSSSGSEETTTKISVNAQGERVMIFMQGDTVIRTVKIGDNGQMLENNVMSNEMQQYVDNGISDIGLALNVSS